MKLWTQFLLVSAVAINAQTQAGDFSLDPAYPAFRERMVKQYGFEATRVDQIMDNALTKPRILSIMNTPGESKPWYEYREQFLTTQKISKGVAFARLYQEALNRAEKEYGVPRAAILGILGVETGFGSNTGSFRAIDALSTLAFGFPRRADYFTDELAELLVYARDQHLNPVTIRSSYAGAIGYPQFMPSSIRKYAVDYDHDGQVNLRDSAIDAIGSIANYLKQHGWQPNQPVMLRGVYSGLDDTQVVSTDLLKPTTAAALAKAGLKPTGQVLRDDEAVSGIKLMEEVGPAYYITYPNFQVITTYNRSRMYATAVWQLGQAIVSEL